MSVDTIVYCPGTPASCACTSRGRCGLELGHEGPHRTWCCDHTFYELNQIQVDPYETPCRPASPTAAKLLVEGDQTVYPWMRGRTSR